MWYHILERMDETGQTTPAQHDFLDYFRSRIDLDTLSIDGIVASFFQELNSTSVSEKSFGQITPWVPAIGDYQFNPGNDFTWPDEYLQSLPNMVAVFRKARRFIIGNGNQQQANCTTFWNLTDEEAPPPGGTPQIPLGTGPRITALAPIQPGTAYLTPETVNSYNRNNARAEASSIVSIPARLNNNFYDDEISYFRQEHGSAWFNQLAKLMARRNRYIIGNQPYSNLRKGTSVTPLFRGIHRVHPHDDHDYRNRAITWFEVVINIPPAMQGNPAFAAAVQAAAAQVPPGIPQASRRDLIAAGMAFDLNAFATQVFAPGFRRNAFDVIIETSEESLVDVDYIRALATLWCLRTTPYRPDQDDLIHQNHQQAGLFWNKLVLKQSAIYESDNDVPAVIAGKWIITKPTDLKLVSDIKK
jgi:hypothetical protein